MISPFQLFLFSILFAVLFLVTSGVMADFLFNLYDRGWHKLQPNQKYTDVLTVSVVSSHSSFLSFQAIFPVVEFHNFPFSLSFIFVRYLFSLSFLSFSFCLVFWFPVRRSFGGGLFLSIQESRSMNEPIWFKVPLLKAGGYPA